MNRLSTEKRAQILGCLVEGMSIRATVRMTGAAKNTVTKLLADVGRACEEYQDGILTDLPCTDLQCDEIWAFCYSKAKNVPEERRDEFGYGDVWTWTAIDADTKLVPTWLVADRSPQAAWLFMQDLASRLRGRVQLTTDGYGSYLRAVHDAFGFDIDYAMLVKQYGLDQAAEKRYSPAVCVGSQKTVISGSPIPERINTSYIERQNLTMRMHMRRFTRLTNAFSKKLENLEAAVALHFMFYNFARVHTTIGTTPAIAAGVTDHKWSLLDIAELAEVTPIARSN